MPEGVLQGFTKQILFELKLEGEIGGQGHSKHREV